MGMKQGGITQPCRKAGLLNRGIMRSEGCHQCSGPLVGIDGLTTGNYGLLPLLKPPARATRSPTQPQVCFALPQQSRAIVCRTRLEVAPSLKFMRAYFMACGIWRSSIRQLGLLPVQP